MMSGAITVDTGGWDKADMRELYNRYMLVSQAMNLMKDGAGAVNRGLSGVSRAFERCAKSASGMLSAMMQTKHVAKGLEKGMANLYKYARQYGKSLARSLDSVSSSAQYLHNSLAAMAAPLIESVAPAVDFVADKFVALFNLINQVFARLAGAGTYIAARRFGKAWANASESVGEAIANASEETEEAVANARRVLMGFDELNILRNSSGGGGGGGGGGYGMMFEEREIEGDIAGFVDQLIEAFRASDWETLGALLGGLINDAIDGIDWHGLGVKVGKYIDGAIQTAYYLLDTVNFKKLGRRIAEFLNGALAEIDFSKLGSLVALFFTSAIETFAGFIEEFDWLQFARKAAEAVNSFVAKLGEKLDAVDWVELTKKLVGGLNAFIHDVDWKALGETFGHRINDLLTILRTAAEEFDWIGAGTALATGLNGLFRSVDWAGLGDWLYRTLTGLLDSAIAFFDALDVEALCEGIKTALSRVDWDSVARKLWQLLSLALSKLMPIIEIIANLTQNGSNWAHGLLKWFMEASGTNIVDLIGRLTMQDDSSVWWSNVIAWWDARKGTGSFNVDPKNESRSWWSSVKGWWDERKGTGSFSVEPKNAGKTWWSNVKTWWDNRKGTGSFSVSPKNESGSWWQKVKSWWDKVKKVLGFSVAPGTSRNDASGWFTEVKTAFEEAAKQSPPKYSVSVRDDSRQWASTVKNSFDRKMGESQNKLYIKGVMQDSSGSWWDSIRNWFNQSGKKNGNELQIKPVVQNASGEWWNNVKKWFNAQGENWWNKLEITPQLVNNTASLWTQLRNWWNQQGSYWWNQLSANVNLSAAASGGVVRPFAGGGFLSSSGVASWWNAIPKYAAGTNRAHGSLFVAGEAGPEIMGHINGRTEILNKSQIASAIYSAVVSGMAQAVNALGRYLGERMALAANAVVTAIGVSGLSGVTYREPLMAGGTVLPYDIAAQIAKTGADIQGTLDANNEDLIQTIISVIGAQTTALVAAIQNNSQSAGSVGISAQQVINEINRRTQMFGVSPLQGL